MGQSWENWKGVNSGMGFDQALEAIPRSEAPSFRAVQMSGGAAMAGTQLESVVQAQTAEAQHQGEQMSELRHPALDALHSYFFDIRD